MLESYVVFRVGSFHDSHVVTLRVWEEQSFTVQVRSYWSISEGGHVRLRWVKRFQEGNGRPIRDPKQSSIIHWYWFSCAALVLGCLNQPLESNIWMKGRKKQDACVREKKRWFCTDIFSLFTGNRVTADFSVFNIAQSPTPVEREISHSWSAMCV